MFLPFSVFPAFLLPAYIFSSSSEVLYGQKAVCAMPCSELYMSSLTHLSRELLIPCCSLSLNRTICWYLLSSCRSPTALQEFGTSSIHLSNVAKTACRAWKPLGNAKLDRYTALLYKPISSAKQPKKTGFPIVIYNISSEDVLLHAFCK